ncbi:putative inorganic phosphate cotransporter [Leptinotarsa decemlineata]|uniref:putative inorganic phosphate cotransporter n=1 Tax=Leptinotarsa decemlineata TaxID=7539 RepID=UPI000C251DDD|nr:putative inorganic phosphate cotransporter [Leptinotarsa decemlineata]
MKLKKLLCCVKNKNDETEKGPYFGSRHVQTIFYFLLFTITYCKRAALSIAIVAMNDNSTSSNVDIETFKWTNESVVLSAFFWGYVIFQIPAAQLSKKVGAKWMLVGCTILDSLSFMIIPIVASHLGSIGVMGCRVLEGLAQGGVSPLVHTLLGTWAPPGERSVLGTFAYSGCICGNILSLSVTGFICSSGWGWPAVFYIFGIIGLMWTLAWIIFGADRPSSHKTITDAERNYIEISLNQQVHKIHKTPWKAIFLSPPFYSVTLAFVGANWGSSVLLTQTPRYLSNIFDYDIKSNSLFSAAPYVAMLICSLTFSPICDWMINNNMVSRTVARKIFNTVGTIFPAISLTMVAFITKEYASYSVALLIINGGISAGALCSYQVNHVDLSPNHSGVLMAITNSSTSIFSIISPLIVQFIVTDPSNQSQWRTIFLVTAGLYLLADIFYIIFGSGDVQPWNSVEENDEDGSSPNISVVELDQKNKKY